MPEYEIRNLTAEDMFPMFNIISKIGFREFKHVFEESSIREAVKKADGDSTVVGVTIAFDVAGIIMENIVKCKEDLYQFLSGLTGMTKAQISKLPMMEFVNLILAVVKKEEFKDFFKAVSALLK